MKTNGKEVRVTVKRNALLSVEEMRSRHYKNSDAPLWTWKTNEEKEISSTEKQGEREYRNRRQDLVLWSA